MVLPGLLLLLALLAFLLANLFRVCALPFATEADGPPDAQRGRGNIKEEPKDQDRKIWEGTVSQGVSEPPDIEAPFFRDPKNIHTGISGWKEVLNDGEPKVEEHVQVVPEEKNYPADEGLLA